ncbi:hypothetical protein M9458_025497 [Cirrhinus mrigala]|uniref:Uncharacterized protein n=1 Tax=Cirrhinus mrigala TaxID=683832 RepID=A0ABD0Q2B2_CIRMR
MNYQFVVKQSITSATRFVLMANRNSSGFSAKASLGEMSNFDLNAGRQMEVRLAVKRKRENSDRSESREQKMSRSDHRSASDCSKDSLSSGCSSLLLGDTSSSDLTSGSQVEMRLGVKRKNERSESTERKRRRSDLQSDSSVDSLTSAFSCMYSSTPPAACGETPMKESSKDEKQSGLSHLNNCEVKPVPDKDKEQSGLSNLNNSEVPSGESPLKGSRNGEEQPGLSLLNNNEVRPVLGKDKEQSGLSHLNNSEYRSGVSPVKASRNDEEQSGLSHPNNSEVKLGQSLMKGYISDDEQPGPSRPVKLDQGVKRKRENYGRSVSSERKKIKLDPDSYPPASYGDASSLGPRWQKKRKDFLQKKQIRAPV